MTGVSVGSTEGPSTTALWECLALLLLLPAAGIVRADEVGMSTSGVDAGCLSVRGRFLFSLPALGGGAKLPTGGIFGPSLAE